jgi:hypothetical protein
MRQWNLLTQWTRLTKSLSVYLINLKNKNMKVGDKVKVVWNEDICGKNGNTYGCNGRIGIISEFGLIEYDHVKVNFDGELHTVYGRALQLVIEDKFTIPKQWHIHVKTPEQAKVVGRWFDQSKFTTPNSPNFYEKEGRLGTYGGVSAGNVYGNDYGTKITYEQFEKYILKQNNKQNNMEIIGYKSPMKIGIHAKGELYIQYSSNEDLYIPDSTKDMGSEAFYSIPKEIVEMWEPVYKETSKTLVLGTSRIKIVISKGKIDVDNGNIIDIVQFKFLYQALTNTEMKGSSRSYDVLFPKGVKIGCSEFEVSEIKLIIDTYNELNK